MYSDTVSCLYLFIIHQNIFCIHRGCFIRTTAINVICKVIAFAIVIVIVIFGITDVIHSNEIFLPTFTMFLMVEHFLLIVGAFASAPSYDMMTKLDHYCGMDAAYAKRMRTKAAAATLLSFILVAIDAANVAYLPRITRAMAFCMWAAFSAHNSDLILYGLLIEGINMRLRRLQQSATTAAAAIQYRHILNGCAHLNYLFQIRVFVILLVIFVSTLVYLLIALLSDASMFNELVAVIITRELISVGCLLYMCSAAAHSDHLCNNLTFHSAGILCARTNRTNKNVCTYDDIERNKLYSWILRMNEERPKYIAGQSIPLNIVTPIDLLNTSATYMLVLIQIYIDYM